MQHKHTPLRVLATAQLGHAHTQKGAAAPNGRHRWDAADSSDREGLTRIKSSDAIIHRRCDLKHLLCIFCDERWVPSQGNSARFLSETSRGKISET